MNNKIIYDIEFKADKKAAEDAIHKIQQEINKIGDIPFNKLTPELKRAQAEATAFQNILKQATSDKGISLSTLNAGLRTAKLNAADLLKTFSATGMTNSFNSVVSALMKANSQVTIMSAKLKEIQHVIIQTAKYQISNTSWRFVTSQIQKATSEAQKLDKTLTDIRIVSGKTAEEMKNIAAQFKAMTQQMSVSMNDIGQAALTFYQQGLDGAEALERAAISLKAAAASGQDVGEMSEQLTAVWNTFGMAGDELQRSASVLSRLGGETASSFSEMATAMQNSASAAATMGVDYNQLAAMIATVSSTSRQSASIIGNSFKTVFSRMADLKLDGMDDAGVTLNKVSSGLKSLGIEILDSSGELKDMGNIINELGKSWSGYSNAQKVAIAELVGGTRQYGQVLTLLNNWDDYLKNVGSAASETGESLEKMYDTYEQGAEGTAKRAGEAWRQVFAAAINENTLKVVSGISEQIAHIVGGVVSGFTSFKGIPVILAAVGLLLSNKIRPAIVEIFEKIKGFMGFDSSIKTIQKQNEQLTNTIKLLRERQRISHTISAEEEKQSQRSAAEVAYNEGEKEISKKYQPGARIKSWAQRRSEKLQATQLTTEPGALSAGQETLSAGQETLSAEQKTLNTEQETLNTEQKRLALVEKINTLEKDLNEKEQERKKLFETRIKHYNRQKELSELIAQQDRKINDIDVEKASFNSNVKKELGNKLASIDRDLGDARLNASSRISTDEATQEELDTLEDEYAWGDGYVFNPEDLKDLRTSRFIQQQRELAEDARWAAEQQAKNLMAAKKEELKLVRDNLIKERGEFTTEQESIAADLEALQEGPTGWDYDFDIDYLNREIEKSENELSKISNVNQAQITPDLETFETSDLETVETPVSAYMEELSKDVDSSNSKIQSELDEFERNVDSAFAGVNQEITQKSVADARKSLTSMREELAKVQVIDDEIKKSLTDAMSEEISSEYDIGQTYQSEDNTLVSDRAAAEKTRKKTARKFRPKIGEGFAAEEAVREIDETRLAKAQQYEVDILQTQERQLKIQQQLNQVEENETANKARQYEIDKQILEKRQQLIITQGRAALQFTQDDASYLKATSAQQVTGVQQQVNKVQGALISDQQVAQVNSEYQKLVKTQEELSKKYDNAVIASQKFDKAIAGGIRNGKANKTLAIDLAAVTKEIIKQGSKVKDLNDVYEKLGITQEEQKDAIFALTAGFDSQIQGADNYGNVFESNLQRIIKGYEAAAASGKSFAESMDAAGYSTEQEQNAETVERLDNGYQELIQLFTNMGSGGEEFARTLLETALASREAADGEEEFNNAIKRTRAELENAVDAPTEFGKVVGKIGEHTAKLVGAQSIMASGFKQLSSTIGNSKATFGDWLSTLSSLGAGLSATVIAPLKNINKLIGTGGVTAFKSLSVAEKATVIFGAISILMTIAQIIKGIIESIGAAKLAAFDKSIEKSEKLATNIRSADVAMTAYDKAIAEGNSGLNEQITVYSKIEEINKELVAAGKDKLSLEGGITEELKRQLLLRQTEANKDTETAQREKAKLLATKGSNLVSAKGTKDNLKETAKPLIGTDLVEATKDKDDVKKVSQIYVDMYNNARDMIIEEGKGTEEVTEFFTKELAMYFDNEAKLQRAVQASVQNLINTKDADYEEWTETTKAATENIAKNKEITEYLKYTAAESEMSYIDKHFKKDDKYDTAALGGQIEAFEAAGRNVDALKAKFEEITTAELLYGTATEDTMLRARKAIDAGTIGLHKDGLEVVATWKETINALDDINFKTASGDKVAEWAKENAGNISKYLGIAKEDAVEYFSTLTPDQRNYQAALLKSVAAEEAALAIKLKLYDPNLTEDAKARLEVEKQLAEYTSRSSDVELLQSSVQKVNALKDAMKDISATQENGVISFNKDTAVGINNWLKLTELYAEYPDYYEALVEEITRKNGEMTQAEFEEFSTNYIAKEAIVNDGQVKQQQIRIEEAKARKTELQAMRTTLANAIKNNETSVKTSGKGIITLTSQVLDGLGLMSKEALGTEIKVAEEMVASLTARLEAGDLTYTEGLAVHKQLIEAEAALEDLRSTVDDAYSSTSTVADSVVGAIDGISLTSSQAKDALKLLDDQIAQTDNQIKVAEDFLAILEKQYDINFKDKEGARTAANELQEYVVKLKDLIQQNYNLATSLEAIAALYEKISKFRERSVGIQRKEYAMQLINLKKMQQQLLKQRKEEEQAKTDMFRADIEFMAKEYGIQLKASTDPALAEFQKEFGVIIFENTKELQEKAKENYLKALAEVGITDISNQSAITKLTGQNKTKADEAKKVYDAILQAIEEFISSQSAVINTSNEILDNILNIEEEQLKTIQDFHEFQRKYYQVVVKGTAFQNTLLDRLTNQNLFGPTNSSAAILNLQRQGYANVLSGNTYSAEWTALMKNYSDNPPASGKYTQDEIAALEATVDGLMSSINELFATNDSIWEKYTGLLAEQDTKIQKYLSNIDNAISTIDKIGSIMELTGQKFRQNAAYIVNLNAKIEAQNNLLESQGSYYRDIEEQIEATKSQMALVASDTESYRKYAEVLKGLEEQLQEMKDSILDTFTSILEDAQTLFTESVDSVIRQLEQSISGFSSFSVADTLIDKAQELDDFYMSQSQSMWSMSTLMNDVDKELTDTNKTYDAKAIKDLTNFRLQAEKKYNEAKEQGRRLTQFEVDFMREEFNLMIAMAAFEDARNAKNQMVLTRDNSGNYRYMYAANEAAASQAKQQVEDAGTNLRKLEEDYVKSLQDSYRASQRWAIGQIQDLEDRLAQGLITWEEYQQEVSVIEQLMAIADQQYYAGLDQLTTYWGDLTQLTIDKVGGKWTMLQDIVELGAATYKETAQSMVEDMGGVGRSMNSLQEIVRMATSAMTSYWTHMQSTMADAYVNFNIALDMADYSLLSLSESAVEASYEIKSAIDMALDSYDDEILRSEMALTKWVNYYESEKNRLIRILAEMQAALEEMYLLESGAEAVSGANGITPGRDLAAQIMDYILSGGTDRNKINALLEARGEKISASGNDYGVSNEALAAYVNGLLVRPDLIAANLQGVVDAYNNRFGQNYSYGGLTSSTASNSGNLNPQTGTNVVTNPNAQTSGTGKKSHYNSVSFFPSAAVAAINQGLQTSAAWIAAKGYGFTATDVKNYLSGSSLNWARGIEDFLYESAGGVNIMSALGLSYAKGGFISRDQIAQLHANEYVLTPIDTQNILAAAETLRNSFSGIQLERLRAGSALMDRFNSDNLITAPITINADFPGVNSQYEIEAAFKNLTNQAIQYISKRR